MTDNPALSNQRQPEGAPALWPKTLGAFGGQEAALGTPFERTYT